MLKKIVGAVSSTEINKVGQGVLNPESTAIYKLQKRYDEGERDRAFMQDLIEEMLNEDQETEEVVVEFLDKHPKLLLENEGDFLIFCLGIDDLQDAHTVQFFKDVGTLKELHGDIVNTKISLMFGVLIDDAVSKGDPKVIDEGLEKIFPAYELVYGEDGYSKKNLSEMLLEVYNE